MKILLIEAEQQYSNWLSAKLSEAGFRPILSSLCEASFRDDDARLVAATVVDISLASPPASQIVRRARQIGHSAPLLVLSDRENWREKVDCLDAGADDFLVKPVRSEEIAARLRAIIRRAAGKDRDYLRCGALEMDLKARTARLDGIALELTRNEFRLLQQFMLWPDRVHSHKDILDLIKQPGHDSSMNAVEVLVARVRRKIGRNSIRTVRGVGYHL